jgi:hypothetical protein
MRQIDYNVEQYQDYARGRALTEPQLQALISGFTGQRDPRRHARASVPAHLVPGMPVPDYRATVLSWECGVCDAGAGREGDG